MLCWLCLDSSPGLAEHEMCWLAGRLQPACWSPAKGCFRMRGGLQDASWPPVQPVGIRCMCRAAGGLYG